MKAWFAGAPVIVTTERGTFRAVLCEARSVLVGQPPGDPMTVYPIYKLARKLEDGSWRPLGEREDPHDTRDDPPDLDVTAARELLATLQKALDS